MRPWACYAILLWSPWGHLDVCHGTPEFSARTVPVCDFGYVTDSLWVSVPPLPPPAIKADSGSKSFLTGFQAMRALLVGILEWKLL